MLPLLLRLQGAPQPPSAAELFPELLPRCRAPPTTPHSYSSAAVLRAGLVMPFLWGDGGRAKENASTSYAYRIKNLYPRS
jgi:hypothetical protein